MGLDIQNYYIIYKHSDAIEYQYLKSTFKSEQSSIKI